MGNFFGLVLESKISGTGGQVDYVRGSMWSRGGKSIMAMPSTAKNGTTSRIVATLTKGTTITNEDQIFFFVDFGADSIGDRYGKQSEGETYHLRIDRSEGKNDRQNRA